MDNRKSNTQWFPGAHNISFVNANFTTIQGDVHKSSSGFALLSQHISHDAMFDSAARYPAGRCHSGTRKEVIQTILTWINDPSPRHSILWLRGLAGVGKSSIAQTISETVSREYAERYAGTFFFRNGVTQAEKLFPTLAYQMGVHRIEVRDILEEIMNQNHSLPTKTMDIQMKSLIIDPLRRASIELGSLHHTPTLIIDGLDECQGSDLQCQILSLIAESLNLHRVPVRFLISSRPEYWIREAFEQEILSSLTSQLSLDAPHLDSYNDIEQYLHDGFEQIYKKKARYMSNVEQPWPSPQIIQTLAYHASGQFIYASTVLKFVGSASDYCDPRKQLEIITRPGPLHATVFSNLDKLYIRILSTFPQLNVLKAVLGSLLMRANPYVIQKFLGLDSGEISLALDSLSSLTRTYEENYHPEDNDLAKIYAPPEFLPHFLFAHRSFEDFISDETRSGAFSINTDAFCEKLAFVFFSSLKGTLDGETDFEENHDIAYRSIYFAIRNLPTLQSAIADLQPQILQFLSSTNRSIQHPTTLLRFFECIQLLLRQSTISQHSICPVIRTLLEEKCYPKIVRHMISSGELAISDILIYMTGPTHIRLNFITDMPGNNFSRTKTFLCGAKGITSFELHQYALPVAEEIDFSSFKLLGSIQSVLDWGGEKLQCVAYRAQCILACFKSWEYIDDHSTFSDHLRDRIARFFHNHRLSDIQDEQDLSIPSFIPLISTIVNHNWGRSPYRDWQDLAIALAQWSVRQCNRGDIMNILEGLDAVLAGEIRNFTRDIYETFFLPEINQLPPHIRETWVCRNRNGRGLSLKVIPSSDGSPAHIYSEEEVVFQDFAVQRWIMVLDVRFLDVMQSIPDDCRPHYANQVVEIRLNSVVKDLYRTLHPGALTSGISQMTFQERDSSYSYLSYVQPTIAILNALRVICYLGSEIVSSRQSSESMVTSLPSPESDLGIFSMCLVEKYEESEISSTERDWFKTCLKNWGAVEAVERSRRFTSTTGLDRGQGEDVLFAADIEGKDNDY